MANQKNKLLNEFPPISTEQWEALIQKDLKGADYEKKLVWNTLEGFKVRPYYRQENLEDKEYLNNLPAEFPFNRGNKTNDNNWEIRQNIEVTDLGEANKLALFILERGVTAIGFKTGGKKGKSVINSVADLEKLLTDIHIDCIGLYFGSGHNGPKLIQYISELVAKQGLDKTKITGAFCYDPLGYLTVKGAWGTDEKTDFAELKSTIEFASSNLPSYRVLSINGHHFNNAGASVVQEIALSLSMAAEYLTKLTDMGMDASIVSKHMQASLGIGSNYFMEIAKIRAARYLFARLFESFTNKKTDGSIHVNSITSDWNQTIYDPYVNVLRLTTEAMAAVLGGTDTLVVKPFDASYKSKDTISERISRNIQIILKEEAYLDKIVDPSAGSYYIESLTDSIIEEAWKLFLTIDSKGGYLNALKEGYIQSMIEETAKKRDNNIASRRDILLGTNQYSNINEQILKQIDITSIFQEAAPEGSVVKTIRKYRGSVAFEKLRLATEKHSKRPKVFMLTYGNLPMRKARASFSCNFFACAGYEVIDNNGFETAEEGVKAALAVKADIVVVCSSDDEYTEFVPLVNNLLKDKSILVVAGAPACMEDLKAKGISNFIHVKSNVLETLKGFHSLMGIKD